MHRSRRVPRAASLCLAARLAAVAIAPAAGVSAPQRILGGPEDQIHPSANETYMIWTQNSEAFSNRYHAYGKVRGTSEVFQLNRNGTRGFAGGIDPDQDRAIYQQIDGQTSDLYTINLATRGRLKLPAPINTARWEWGPRISNAFYLFARDAHGKTTLFLYDRAAKTIQSLMSHDLVRYYVSPSAVGERYATWSVCGPFTCTAFVRDTVTDRTRRIPAPDGLDRYAPIVDEREGLVYFVRSGSACGSAVRIMRVPTATLGATPTTLATLPGGIDVDYRMSLVPLASQVDLWFSRVRCASQRGDIYRLRDVGIA
ncbi:MAG: hypothetical protein ACR2L4_07990 [Actinomycetota bacterium]